MTFQGLTQRGGTVPTDPGFPQIIKKLIERKQAQIRKVYPGLSCFKEGVRQIPVESVPGIRELRGLGGVVRGEGHPLARSRQTISSLPSPHSTGETGWKPVGKEKG